MSQLSHVSRRQWLSAAGLLTLHGFAGCSKSTNSEPIWVGHVGRLGGDDRDAGDMAVNAMQLTLADLKEADVTIAGRPIAVRHADGPTKDRARAEASRLMAVNRVACLIVGPRVEGVSEIVAIGRSNGTAVVVLGEVVDPTLADQAILLGVDPRTLGEMLARYTIAAGYRKRVATWEVGTDARTSAILKGFTRVFVHAGGEVVTGLSHGQLFDRHIRKKDVPEVVIETAGLNLLIKEPEEQRSVGNLGIPVIDLHGVRQPTSENEIWMPTMFPDPSSLSAEGKAWVESFAKRFEKQPTDEALLAHDGIAVIAVALQTVGSEDRRKLTEDLAGRSEFAGLTGTIGRKDGRPLRPMFLTRQVKGKRLPTVSLPIS